MHCLTRCHQPLAVTNVKVAGEGSSMTARDVTIEVNIEVN